MMREKKYANVLDDYQEVIEEEKKEQSEEKLSMTRELKFKELQDNIDNEDVVAPMKTRVEVRKEKELKTMELSNTLNEVKALEETGKVEIDKETISDKEVMGGKTSNDDLYLTASFKPFKKRFRMKKVFKVLFSMIFVTLLVVLVTYFVGIPLYNKYLNSKPKAIFENTIDYIAAEVYNVIDSNYYEQQDYSFFELNFMFDTNSEEFKDYSGMYLGTRVQTEGDNFEELIYVKDSVTSEEYGLKLINKDGIEYSKFSHSDKYFKYDIEEDSNDSLVIEENDELSFLSLTKEEYKYLIEKERDAYKVILDNEYISYEADEIEIDGKSLDVVKNSFTIDEKNYEVIVKKFNEILLDDDKYLEIYAKFVGTNVSDVKEEYFSDDIEVEEDYTLTYNIYTVSGNKVVGIDVEENGFRIVYLYFNENYFDLHLNLTNDEDCLEGKDCALENSMVIDLTGTKKKDYTEVVVKYNDSKVATLDVRSFNFDKIDLDYEIDYMDTSLEGSLLLNMDTEKQAYSIELETQDDVEYIKAVMNLKLGQNGKVETIPEENIVAYSEKALDADFDELYLILEEKGLLVSYDMWLTLMLNAQSGETPNIEDFGVST